MKQLALGVILTAGLTWAAPAVAGECWTPALEPRFAASTDVFSGTVLEVTGKRAVRVRLRVDHRWKGGARDEETAQLTVRATDYRPQVGDEYVVMATRSADLLRVMSCGHVLGWRMGGAATLPAGAVDRLDALAAGTTQPADAPSLWFQGAAGSTEGIDRTIVRVRGKRRGAIRANVVGDGQLCDLPAWRVARQGSRIDLTLDPGRVASAAGTCAVVVELRGLAAGAYTLTVAGTTAAAAVR